MYSKQTETCGSFTQKSPQAYCVYQYIQNDHIVSSLTSRSTPKRLIFSAFRDYSQQSEMEGKAIF